jgi:hypothetical protein
MVRFRLGSWSSGGGHGFPRGTSVRSASAAGSTRPWLLWAQGEAGSVPGQRPSPLRCKRSPRPPGALWVARSPRVPNGAVTAVTGGSCLVRGSCARVLWGGVPVSLWLAPGFPEPSGSWKGCVNPMTCPQPMVLTLAMNPESSHIAQGTGKGLSPCRMAAVGGEGTLRASVTSWLPNSTVSRCGFTKERLTEGEGAIFECVLQQGNPSCFSAACLLFSIPPFPSLSLSTATCHVAYPALHLRIHLLLPPHCWESISTSIKMSFWPWL